MLGKLSFRNAKRQAKDYCIYFITVIISVALMFSFNSIATSNDISELSFYMASFSKAISGISILIVLVMAWLINYCMRFMLEKEAKEFGTYQILGIEKKSISNIFYTRKYYDRRNSIYNRNSLRNIPIPNIYFNYYEFI